MINKRFENKENGNVVVIKQDDGIWFTLTNGSKIKKDSFFDKYTEIIDPVSFFNNMDNIESYTKQLNKIDTNTIINEGSNDTLVKRVDDIPQTPASKIDQKQQMINNYLKEQELKNKELSQYKQIQNDEEAANQLLSAPNNQTSKPVANNPNYPEFDPNIKKDRDKTQINDYYKQNLYTQPQSPVQPEDTDEEAFKFFKNFKNNHKITIKLEFDEFIAEPEFLKLMLNNFEADVIKYYTKKILKTINSDPQKVEEKIYDQIEEIVTGEKKIKKKIIEPENKNDQKIEQNNDQKIEQNNDQKIEEQTKKQDNPDTNEKDQNEKK